LSEIVIELPSSRANVIGAWISPQANALATNATRTASLSALYRTISFLLLSFLWSFSNRLSVSPFQLTPLERSAYRADDSLKVAGKYRLFFGKFPFFLCAGEAQRTP
jgi:hypothetical protein